MRLPEFLGQRTRAGVQEIGVFQHLVVEIIFGGESERTRLDAHVDIFGHQNDLALGLLLLQVLNHADDLIVSLAAGQARWKFANYGFGLQKQAAIGIFIAMRGQGDAFCNISRRVAQQLIEIATRLARIARDFGHAFLVIVELFKRGHRNEKIVFLEAEQTGGIVHQDIGVEHEKFGGGV